MNIPFFVLAVVFFTMSITGNLNIAYFGVAVAFGILAFAVKDKKDDENEKKR